MFRLLVALVVTLVTAHYAAASFISPRQVRVIEGDTIVAEGRTVRLSGFVTPESQGARCAGERELGLKAVKRVRELIQAGNLDYSPIACSCPTTILGRLMCRVTRTCGVLRANGLDIGDILISEGLRLRLSVKASNAPRHRVRGASAR
jgi:endonuclease YncB( thermonuclease family)